MHGGAAVSKNVRRTGIPATIKGQPNPAYGPTAERLAKADGHVSVGDNQRGTRIYHFHDNPLDRMYSRLTRQARAGSDEAGLRREYLALTKYRHHWHAAGLQASIGSAELDRVFASDPAGMSGMAKTEHQAHHRKQYREAVELIGWKPHIVVDNIVCAGLGLAEAGSSIGYGDDADEKTYKSRYRAREAASGIIREAGQVLARHWGIS